MEQKNILFGVFVFLAVFVFLVGGIYAEKYSVAADSKESEMESGLSASAQFVDAPQAADMKTSAGEVELIEQPISPVTVAVDSDDSSSGVDFHEGNSTYGNFLMGTDGADAIFWGTFNGNTHTLSGEVLWLNNPSIRRVGVGSYIPTSYSSGSLSIHFSDPNNAFDPGLNWTGSYGHGRWTIFNNQTGNSVALAGRVLQAPF